MSVPVSLRIAALAVATTAFYTYVGQLVPQKECCRRRRWRSART